MKLTRIASLPLRTKLTAAIAIPIVGLIGLSAAQVQGLTADVSATEAQLVVVESNVTVAEVAAAIRTERDVQLSVVSLAGPLNRSEDGRNSYYDRVRAETDAVIASALQDSSLSSSDRQDIEATRVRLLEARADIGNDPHQIRDNLVAELASGASAGDAPVSAAMGTFDQIVTDTIQLIDVEANSDLNSQSALDLTTLQLSNAFDEAIRLEALSYLELSLLTPEEQSETLVLAARTKGAQAVQLERIVREVGSPELAPSFDVLINGPRYQAFVDLRNDVATQEVGEITVPRNAVFFVLLALTNNLTDIRDEITETASATAVDSNDSAERQLLIGGGALVALLGLVALLTVTLFRSIRRPLLTLTERSRAISDVELPNVVKLLREKGLTAEVPEIVPIESETDDEVGELVAAFNDMHRTAVELASEQAASRRTVADMFVNLGRRNQRLLMRILDYLDGLEANEEDPETLERLFKIDHLATRMRRNAESLLVLAGAREARVFEQPVSIADVVRSALGEVEGYERVDLDVRTDKLIDGSAVADTAHLLAELIENSLAFSPPSSRVTVTAADSPKGFVVAVADTGIGMSLEAMAAANETINRANSLEETPSKDLGHHVVGRLSGRHGIRVELREGITDGLVAKVSMPQELLSSPTDETAPVTEPEQEQTIASEEAADRTLSELFSAEDEISDETDDTDRRDRASVEALGLTIDRELEAPNVSAELVTASDLAPVTAEAPAITETDIESIEPVAAEWSDPAPAVLESVETGASDDLTQLPMSVAEASRRAREGRPAAVEAQTLPIAPVDAGPKLAPEAPSVLETTSGFALARRRPAAEAGTPDKTEVEAQEEAPPAHRRRNDEPAPSTNPLGVTRTPGTNLPVGVKPTMDMPSTDQDPVLVGAAQKTTDDSAADRTDASEASLGGLSDAGSRFAASLASFQTGIQRATSPDEDTEASS